jgi:1-acyl-sn-glycerol-3-phosphate acyltransferase
LWTGGLRQHRALAVGFHRGAVHTHAPKIVQFIPRLWGYLPVYRGTGSTYALKEANRILKSGGVVGIFPEGGSWAQILRLPVRARLY